MTETTTATVELTVPHFVRGAVVEGAADRHTLSGGVVLRTPELQLDQLVRPRTEGFPAMDLTLDEVLDFLAATGKALERDKSGHVAAALDALASVNPVGGGMLRAHMNSAIGLFDRGLVRFEFDQALGAAGQGWEQVVDPHGRGFEKRWFPTRCIHVLAGNTPHGGPLAIIRTALVRGVALLKMPSNDPFTPTAVLRTMAELDPGHPIVRSVDAVYWRGGDAAIESVLFRPQFFDKLVAWGGDSAIRNAAKYVGPGFELISFDPKTSISAVGAEAFASAESIAQVAALAAADVRYQEGCGTSRIQYVEGSTEQADAYCEQLLAAMHRYHEEVGGTLVPTPSEITDEVDGLRNLEPIYRVWGKYDGSGLVIRSDEPVDFYPDARTVNVVQVDQLDEVVQHVNVATQTVGVYPPRAKAELRDRLAAGGVDRITDLGNGSGAATGGLGVPHDGVVALHRLVRWIFSHPAPPIHPD